jgi:hypothetical protein
MEPRPAGVRAARIALWQGGEAAARRPSFGDQLSARGGLLSMAGKLVTPFVIVGYLGVASLLVLPLLALRGMFPRRPMLVPATA